MKNGRTTASTDGDSCDDGLVCMHTIRPHTTFTMQSTRVCSCFPRPPTFAPMLKQHFGFRSLLSGGKLQRVCIETDFFFSLKMLVDALRALTEETLCMLLVFGANPMSSLVFTLGTLSIAFALICSRDSTHNFCIKSHLHPLYCTGINTFMLLSSNAVHAIHVN